MKVLTVWIKSCLLSRSSIIFRRISCKNSSKLPGPPWRILFFGTDDFALQSLKALCSKLNTATLINSLGIVTKKGSAVEEFGKAEKLQSYSWPLKRDEIEKKYDIGMVVSFGKLIPNEVIQSFPLGCINVHASILPRWRGAAPTIHTIINGDTETGITIMRIHPYRFDVGDIVRQYRIPVDKDEFSINLEKKLAICGSNLLMECLRDLPRCVEMAVPQSSSGITYAPKIKSDMAVIDWNKMPARIIYNLHRAITHFYPLRTKWHGKPVKFTDIRLDVSTVEPILDEKDLNNTDDKTRKSALDFLNCHVNNAVDSLKVNSTGINGCDGGKISFSKGNNLLKVKCCDGNFLIIKRIVISGKSVSALDFYNGFLVKLKQDDWIFKS